MPSKQILLVDCDEVILGWTEAFKSHAERELGRKITKPQEQFELNSWLDLSIEDTEKMIYNFNDFHPDFETLKPILQSDTYLPKLATDFNIVVITACSEREQTRQKRIRNLTNVFGHIFYDVHCVQSSNEKVQYLSSYPASYWIEDRTPNAVQGYRCGHKSVMIRHPHNVMDEELHPELIWLDNWAQVYDLLSNSKMDVK